MKREIQVEIQRIVAINPDADGRPRRILIIGVSKGEDAIWVYFPDHDSGTNTTLIELGIGRQHDAREDESIYGVDGTFKNKEYSDNLDYEDSSTKGKVWVAEFELAKFPGLATIRCGVQSKALRIVARRYYDLLEVDGVVTKSFSDLKVECGYELGVLFVHGIGEQRSTDTLRHWSSVIQQWINQWFLTNSTQIAQHVERGEVESLCKDLRDVDESCRDTNYINRLDLACKLFQELPKEQKYEYPEELRYQGTLAGRAEFDVGELLETWQSRGEPRNTTLNIETLEAGGSFQRSQWLFAETHWASVFMPPTFVQVSRWYFEAGPTALAYYTYRLSTRSSGSALSDLLAATVLTLAVTVVGLALAATLMLAIFPSDRLRNVLVKIQRTLTGVIGDSYIYTKDELQQKAIMARFQRDFQWLSTRCRKIVVVAHSQGAAVAVKRLCGFKHHKLDTLVTLGSGLQTLDALERAKTSGTVQDIGLLMMIGMLIIGVGSAWLIGSHAALGGILMLSGALLVARGTYKCRKDLPEVISGKEEINKKWALLSSLYVNWYDFYASHDLVPFGPWIDIDSYSDSNRENTVLSYYKPREIRNRESYISDHNTYWDNTEEYVAPLVRILTGAAKCVPLFNVYNKDRKEGVLSNAVRRRRSCVKILHWSRWVAIVSCLGLLFLCLDSVMSFLEMTWSWLTSILSLTSISSQFPPLSLWLSVSVPVVPLIIYWGVTTPTWRGWSNQELAVVLAGRSPPAVRLWLFLFVLSLMTMVLIPLLLLIDLNVYIGLVVLFAASLVGAAGINWLHNHLTDKQEEWSAW